MAPSIEILSLNSVTLNQTPTSPPFLMIYFSLTLVIQGSFKIHSDRIFLVSVHPLAFDCIKKKVTCHFFYFSKSVTSHIFHYLEKNKMRKKNVISKLIQYFGYFKININNMHIASKITIDFQ